MSDQTNFSNNEPVFVSTGSTMEQPTRTNRSALFGMVFAILPTIGFVFLLTLLYILPKFPAMRTCGPLLEILGLLLGVFMFASYPLAFILGTIGLRQIAKSDGQQKGKKLAWTAIVLSNSYCLVLWVLPIGGIIYRFVFHKDALLQPPVLQTPQRLVSEGQRFDYPLFSIGAPQGSGWTYIQLGNGISFESRETLDEGKTFQSERAMVARVWHEALSQQTNYSKKEFLEFACTSLNPLDEENRYAEQQRICDWWKELPLDCVRLEGRYTDHGSKDNPYSPPLILDSHSLACRHPDFYNAVIFLDFSQRGPEGSIEENVSQQADIFFTSLGMNYPPGTPPAEFEYEASQEIQTSQPGANLAYRKQVKVSRQLSDFPASMAVDGSSTNWWSAGARPIQWIDVDLGENYVIAEVRLLISQSPAGKTIHRVLAKGAATKDEFSLIHTFEGVTSNSELLAYKLPEPLRGIRYIRIETTYSPSWVGWREIEVIAGQ